MNIRQKKLVISISVLYINVNLNQINSNLSKFNEFRFLNFVYYFSVTLYGCFLKNKFSIYKSNKINNEYFIISLFDKK